MDDAKSKSVLSIADAVQRAGSSKNTIYNEINAGRLKACKIGRRTVIKVADFRAWLDSLPAYPNNQMAGGRS